MLILYDANGFATHQEHPHKSLACFLKIGPKRFVHPKCFSREAHYTGGAPGVNLQSLPMTHEPGGGGVFPTTDGPERSFLEHDRDSQYSIVDLAGRGVSFSGDDAALVPLLTPSSRPTRAWLQVFMRRGERPSFSRAVAGPATHCRPARATGAAVRAPLPRGRHALSGCGLIACTASWDLWVWTRWCANTWTTALFPAAAPRASVRF